MKYQDIQNFKQIKNFRGKSKLYTQSWYIVQDTLFRLSPQFMYGWRNFILKIYGAIIGEGVLIRPTVKILHPWKVTIGDYSWIGDGVTLLSAGKINIGTNTVISQNSFLAAGGHDPRKVSFDTVIKPITIGDEVWLQTDVFVAPGVVIEKGAVIGFRSTVTKNIPKGMICFGNPAKPIKPR